MPLQSQIQPSFSAGELSPTLYARVDLAKYKVGAALMKNMIVDYRGGASNRPGTQFVGPSYSTTARLIPFQFSTIQSYILVFDDFFMRVIRDGAYVTVNTRLITNITQAATAVVTSAAHGFTDFERVQLFNIQGMVQLNNRYVTVRNPTANTFELYDFYNSAIPINSTGYTAYSASGAASNLYTLTTPYALADLPLLKYTQSADVMTITHPSYAPRSLTRTGHASWTLSTITFGASIAPPTGLNFSFTGGAAGIGGSERYIWCITAVDGNGQESIGLYFFQITATSQITPNGTIFFLSWTPSVGAVQYIVYRSRNVYWAGGALDPIIPPQDFGYIGISSAPMFADNVMAPDFSKTPPLRRNPFAPLAIASVSPSAFGTAYNPILDRTTTIADASGSGAIISPIISATNAGVRGVRGYEVISGGSNYTAPGVTVVTATGSGATSTVTLTPATGLFPAACTYFQQRLVFGGSANNPTTLWMTKPGSFANMDISLVSQDDDAITATLSSLQVNNIKSMIAATSGLLVLTGYGIWLITGGSSDAPITPTSIVAKPQEYGGASDLQPLAVLSDVLYVQAKGSVIRNLIFNLQTNVYSGNDLTVLSNHFFHSYTLPQWTYADAPFKIVWVIRSDGSLLSMTYLKEQEIFGWAKHDTDGVFKSVASITRNNVDDVYFLTNRTYGGGTPGFIELLANRVMFNNIDFAWFLDCALNYNGAATNTVTGMSHLEGRTVAILADRTRRSDAVVTNGAVTVSGAAATYITIGLPYTSRLQTLALDTGGGEIQGKRKEIPALTVRIVESYGFKIGPDFTTMQIWKADVQNFNGTIGATGSIYTGDYRRTISKGWNEQAQVCFEQSDPFPMHISGVIPEFSTGDQEMKRKA